MTEIKTNSYMKKDLKPATVDELKSAFEKCHNYIYANEGLLKEKIFNEILKLIFIKMVDEKSNQTYTNFYINDIEFEELKGGKKSQFSKRIIELFEKVKSQFSDIFQDPNEKINLKPLTLGFIINQLQNYSLIKTPVDVKGIAFQTFVYAHQRGERGEFFTPIPVINLILKIINPKENEKIIDPACGSGGFLVGTVKLTNKNIQKQSEFEIWGVDINPDLIKVAKMQMILNDVAHNHIFTANSLLSQNNLESFDVLMTNPPFGSKGKISDNQILKGFELGYKWSQKEGKWKKGKLVDGQAPEVLFIERCLQFLKNGGRMAIVLPGGILENPSQKYIRKFIRNKAKVLAIIKLPQETFIPYGTGISASILFLQKLSPHQIKEEIQKNYKIFFGIIENIGYEGTKIGKLVYKRNEKGEIIKDEKGVSIINEDITEITEAYKDFIESKQFVNSNKIFLRNYNEIKGRFDPKFYQPMYKELRKNLLKAGAVPLEKVVNIISKKAQILRNPEALIKYIEIGDINTISSELISYNEMKVYEAPSRASYEVRKGDLITAVAGVSTGTKKHASAYITEEFDGCICTNGFRVLRTKNEELNLDPFYLLYFLRSKEFLMQMYRYRTGATIPAVSDTDLKKILILIPEKRIQDEIVKKVKRSYRLRRESQKIMNKLGNGMFNEI
ncbi:MAG: N-6 DNA methylase [Candidatus Helarchaeota archaeon]|nr:N-6 DNA methylase [Candidatus Helarchaeota archaeon]